MNTVGIFIGLFLATALYAMVLDQNKEKWEPDWTWLEVVIGVALCLLAAALAARLDEPHWRDYEWNVWTAFMVGGTPIIIWRLVRVVTNRDRAVEFLRGRTKALAEKQRGGSPGDRGSGEGRPEPAEASPPGDQAKPAPGRADDL